MMSSPINDDFRRRLFYPVDDDGNVAGEFIQEKFDCIALQRTRAEAYREGHTHIHIDVTSGREGPQLYLIFDSIPFGRDIQCCATRSDLDDTRIDSRLIDSRRDCQCNGMLVVPGYSRESAKNVIAAGVPIASRVRLALPQDRKQLFGESLAGDRFSSAQTVFKIVGILSEREVGTIAPLVANEEGSGERGLVESVPKVFDGIGSKPPQFYGEDFEEAHLDHVLANLRIELNDASAHIWIGEKFFANGSKFLRFFSSPFR